MKKAMLFSLVFIFFASVWGSPLFFGSYGSDSAFFSMMGRLILEGKVVYRDYYDVKGPLFFFWEAFGQFFLKGRNGIFLIECICILASSAFLYKICSFYELKKKAMILVHAIFYLIYLGALWGGNTCEEYCLPLLLFCLYLTLVFLKDGVFKWYQPFVFGITFACCAMSKLTIAAPLLAMVIMVMIYLSREKRFRDLGICAGLFFAGALLLILPVIIYYQMNHALANMIDWAYVKAFVRATDFDYDTVGNEYNDVTLYKRLLYMIPCYVGLFAGISSYKEGEKDRGLLLTLMTVLTFISLWLGTSYIYYYIMEMPVLIMCAVMLPADLADGGSHVVKWLRSRFTIVAFIIACVVFSRQYFRNIPVYTYMVSTNVTQLLQKQVNDMYALIPDEEKEDILYLSPGPMFFEANNIIPETKCPNNMEYLMELDPSLYYDMMDRLNSDDQPKWVLTSSIDEINIPDAVEIIKRDYRLYAKGNMNQLYHLSSAEEP